jgi:hypothetical protein
MILDWFWTPQFVEFLNSFFVFTIAPKEATLTGDGADHTEGVSTTQSPPPAAVVTRHFYVYIFIETIIAIAAPTTAASVKSRSISNLNILKSDNPIAVQFIRIDKLFYGRFELPVSWEVS